MKISTEATVKIALGVAIIGVVAYAVYSLKKGTQAVATAVNPLNNSNIINEGATSVYQGITGSTGSMGTDAYNGTHNDDGSLNGVGYALIYGPLAPAKAVWDWLTAPSN